MTTARVVITEDNAQVSVEEVEILVSIFESGGGGGGSSEEVVTEDEDGLVEAFGAPTGSPRVFVEEGNGSLSWRQLTLDDIVAGTGAHREMTALGNSGSTAYPTSSAYRVGYLSTIVDTAADDHDSIRLFSNAVDVDDAVAEAGMTGRVVNATIYIIDLYPPTGGRIFYNGTLLSINEPLEMTPGVALTWLASSGVTWYLS